MNLLFLKGFNNYFNRKIKKYSDLQDYKDKSDSYYDFTDINFNPNDGIATVQIVGSENQKQPAEGEPTPLDWENDGSPDYVIAYDFTVEPDPENENLNITVNIIKSRWFVLESVRERLGQYKLALKRDIIADHLEQILTNPCFVEKGWVNDINNPLLYNDEGTTVNQIKREEIPLTDETGIPWICIYTGKSSPDTVKTITTKMFSDPSNIPNVVEYDDLPWTEDGTFTNKNIYANGKFAMGYNLSWHVYWISDRMWGTLGLSLYDNAGDFLKQYVYGTTDSGYTFVGDWGTEKSGIKAIFNAGYDKESKYISAKTILRNGGARMSTSAEKNAIISLRNSFKSAYGKSLYLSDSSIMNYNKKVIHRQYIDNGNEIDEYYKCEIELLEAVDKSSRIIHGDDDYGYFNSSQGAILPPVENAITEQKYWGLLPVSSMTNLNSNCTTITSRIGTNIGIDALIPEGGSVRNRCRPCIPIYNKYKITYTKILFDEIQVGSGGLGAASSLLNPTFDAAYNLWCLPYGEIPVKTTINSTPVDYISSPEASLAIARAIATELGDGCYDVQLLPYCPSAHVLNTYKTSHYIDLTTANSLKVSYHNILDSDSKAIPYSFMIMCDSCRGTFDINTSLSIDNNDAFSAKIDSMTKMYRLCSPNYSGIFEFSLAKNGGNVELFNVDYLYKPYSPYIHINPDFNFLYGSDWNDARGLILGGDYSVGYYSSAWANYQLNNKNYENIFNRQITNLDVNNKIAYEQNQFQNAWGIASNTLGMGASGASSGISMSGSPWGALAGGIVGTVYGAASSAAAFVKDEEWLTRQQQEARQYMIDMYNMNLENIQAMPYSLSKTDALNGNTRYFPFIEIYKCTDDEISLMQNKLIYDGMTINAIGRLGDFIKINNESDDFTKLKGRLIMIDNIIDDFHITDAIYQEVNKGFYLVSEIEGGEPEEEPEEE